MDGHNDLLGELASDAGLERSDFLVQSTEQLRKFLDRHRERISAIGGLTLIDEEPDYLSIAPDLTFRSRSRYLDDVTGEWVSETEVIEHASELVELYNPADIYAAFAEASREAAGFAAEPTGEEDVLAAAGISLAETVAPSSEDPYAAAADSWAAGQSLPLDADDDEAAAHRLYDLALEYQERSQRNEARILSEFEGAAAGLSSVVGELIIVDDDDERLVLTGTGTFHAEVIPEDAAGRVAAAEQRRRARRVLRPDRRLRRPGRLAGRGLPVGRAGAGGRRRGEAADDGPATSRSPTSPRPIPSPPTTTGRRTSRPRDDAARRGGARRKSRDPPGSVAPGLSRPGDRVGLAGRPVRPRPDRGLLRDGAAPPVLA